MIGWPVVAVVAIEATLRGGALGQSTSGSCRKSAHCVSGSSALLTAILCETGIGKGVCSSSVVLCLTKLVKSISRPRMKSRINLV